MDLVRELERTCASTLRLAPMPHADLVTILRSDGSRRRGDRRRRSRWPTVCPESPGARRRRGRSGCAAERLSAVAARSIGAQSAAADAGASVMDEVMRLVEARARRAALGGPTVDRATAVPIAGRVRGRPTPTCSSAVSGSSPSSPRASSTAVSSPSSGRPGAASRRSCAPACSRSCAAAGCPGGSPWRATVDRPGRRPARRDRRGDRRWTIRAAAAGHRSVRGGARDRADRRRGGAPAGPRCSTRRSTARVVLVDPRRPARRDRRLTGARPR